MRCFFSGRLFDLRSSTGTDYGEACSYFSILLGLICCTTFIIQCAENDEWHARSNVWSSFAHLLGAGKLSLSHMGRMGVLRLRRTFVRCIYTRDRRIELCKWKALRRRSGWCLLACEHLLVCVRVWDCVFAQCLFFVVAIAMAAVCDWFNIISIARFVLAGAAFDCVQLILCTQVD